MHSKALVINTMRKVENKNLNKKKKYETNEKQ